MGAVRPLTTRSQRKRPIVATLVVAVLAISAAGLVWYKVFREAPQPEWVTGDQESKFLYGSIGTEDQNGLPYWIVVVLPRVFGSEYLPGPGGYAALLPWEEGKELPVGFSKKTIGFERVSFNCALCHTNAHRLKEHDTPRVVAAGQSHPSDIQGLANFFTRSASDARFNADTILTEIDLAYPLSWTDRLLYRYFLIPAARKRLIELGRQFASPHEPAAAGGRPGGAFPALGHLISRVRFRSADSGS
jgi:hypothetical protein